MKLGIFNDNRIGLIVADQTLDITALVADLPGDTGRGCLQGVIAAGDLSSILSAERLATAPRAQGDIQWKTPILYPSKIIGAPANYRNHVEEMGNPTTIEQWGLFLKATSSIIGPDETIHLPYSDVRTDQEGELAVIIGTKAKNVRPENALDYVFGYSCILDITTRSTEDRSMRKSYDTFTPLGPYIVTADEIADPDNLQLRCWVNDTLRQDANTSAMIFGVRDLIAYASSVMTLHPGDVVATGTPEGVGGLIDGDTVVVEIENVGTLSVAVSAEHAVPYASRPRAGSRRETSLQSQAVSA
ncbi:fumarylacetoacetate hydrolase family protein (plasmid) [Arthrobacter sp. zg-Y820]|uniref:fumarylacetoacetate hydrolase family protein n=1 Tax=unclassified Arthrobacter TaxID=235627 RepID=UPI001E5F4C08|nr:MULTISPECIES: fumarylacetoacetate hydrolase family protein [unclassified Arthrobacter]MCC9198500.1 fumarylacetoacetate hydrolase family protein [Arthrobacter sp. zg-Y820]MDK1281370.1 fumarylacetoacetate hydrolase family protein [Arthrobacter sp. zg.Y820]WIB11238.1 fumarylacetoacetate hydrolase family protein [Arthrobacter sp. zg-Y820]